MRETKFIWNDFATILINFKHNGNYLECVIVQGAQGVL